MTVINKRLIAIVHDACMSGFALWLAIITRYGFDDMPPSDTVLSWVAIFVCISAIVFKVLGLGRGLWRFASLADLRAIFIATSATVLIFLVVLFLITRLEDLPRTVPLITWFMMIVLIGGPRLAYRAYRDGNLSGMQKPAIGVKHVLLAGHVRDAEQVIRTHQLESSGHYKVHGLVCDNEAKSGHSIRGIPILGRVQELKSLAERLDRSGKPLEAILSVTNRPSAEFTKALTQTAAELGIPVKRAGLQPLNLSEPDFSELTIDDLLGRPSVKLDTSRMSDLINGQTILVTGAGGSIGSEVVRQILKYGPGRLVLLDNSEFALYKIDQEVGVKAPSLPRSAVIADVRDRDRIHSVVVEEKADIIFHAAALKHVPLVESNPIEAIRTNIIGTRNVADAAIKAKASGFVLISTDKAVKPTSIMGATKRAAEAYCQALDVSGTGTRFITVRFGNVLGSNGFRNSTLPPTDRRWRAGDHHTPRNEALFHDYPGSC